MLGFPRQVDMKSLEKSVAIVKLGRYKIRKIRD